MKFMNKDYEEDKEEHYIEQQDKDLTNLNI